MCSALDRLYTLASSGHECPEQDRMVLQLPAGMARQEQITRGLHAPTKATDHNVVTHYVPAQGKSSSATKALHHHQFEN